MTGWENETTARLPHTRSLYVQSPMPDSLLVFRRAAQPDHDSYIVVSIRTRPMSVDFDHHPGEAICQSPFAILICVCKDCVHCMRMI